VSNSPYLVLNKPLVATSPREDKSPARQLSINHEIRGLVFLSGIGQRKRGFAL
jgi:hypothetical protein